MNTLRDKVADVTGAAGGVGRAAARQVAREAHPGLILTAMVKPEATSGLTC